MYVCDEIGIFNKSQIRNMPEVTNKEWHGIRKSFSSGLVSVILFYLFQLIFVRADDAAFGTRLNWVLAPSAVGPSQGVHREQPRICFLKDLGQYSPVSFGVASCY